MTVTIREDLADEYRWTRIETNTDEFGQLNYKYTVYDNDTKRYEEFDNGLRVRNDLYDISADGSAVDWQFLIRKYDGNGQLTEKTTLFDNDTIRTVDFSDGLRVRTTKNDISADGSAVNWKYSTRDYDSNGQLTEKFTHYDNDIGRKVDFSNGLRVGILQNDMSADGSAFNWNYSIRHYDGNGQLTEKLTDYDNDIVRREEFDNGLRVRTVQWDDSADGSAVDWQEIIRKYDDDGQLAYKFTHYDNDIERHEEFDNGLRVRIVHEDHSAYGSAVDWQYSIRHYDGNGQLTDKFTHYDNDTTRHTEFDNGLRVRTVQEDRSADGSAVNWQFSIREYDSNGQLTDKITLYDNDIERHEEFSNGLRRFTVQEDTSADGSAVDWRYSIREYDSNGQLFSKDIWYDNDTTSHTQFENGVLLQTFREDKSADGSAEDWQVSVRDYDDNGQLTDKYIWYDNDTTRHKLFDNGLHVRTVQEDTSADGSAVNWQEIVTNYDTEGNVTNRIRLDDDGDQFVFEFSEGAVTRSIVSDGDESDDWLIKVTTFDTDQGSEDIVTYDSLNDVPDDVLVYFDFDFV